MALNSLGVVFFAAILLISSIFIILKFDRARIWDHTARSLVQGAIAVVTVYIALALFDRQLFEQQSRNQRQQESAASAFLRSQMLSLGLSFDQIPKLYEQTSASACLSSQCLKGVSWLDEIVNGERGNFTLPKPIDRAELLQLFRTTTAMNESLTLLIVKNSNVYERQARGILGRVGYAVWWHNKSAASNLNGPQDFRLRFKLFRALSKIQADSALVLGRYVCFLNEIAEHFKSNSPISEIAEMPAEIKCPPFDRPFASAITWQAKNYDTDPQYDPKSAPLTVD